jgi:DNA topoisomerase I
MKLIIVESPAKASKISSYVGKDYIVLSSYGHICDLGVGNNFGIGVNLQDNFRPYYVLMKDKINILNEIIDTASKSDGILLASDGDLEGEAIAGHLQRYLLSTNKPIKRITFNEITKSAILKAIDNTRDIDKNLVSAQSCRRILDRIIGFKVSPYLINFYGTNLSAGRVQSVATRMIVDKEADIEIFKPEEFWNIYTKFQTQNNEIISTKLQARPTNKEAAHAIVDDIKNQKEFFVSSVIAKKQKEKSSPPFTTIAMQQYMAKKYGFEPDRTMKSAQALYESGFCTYIRTDSVRISVEILQPTKEWLIKNGFDAPKKYNEYIVGDNAADAHECIRPTNPNTTPDTAMVSGDDKLLYRAIWQHFIASQMNPAIWSTLQVVISARNNDKLTFVVSGKALEYKGYLEIFGDIDISKIDIPALQKGDILMLPDNAIKPEQKFTQPPPRYNTASLLKELEAKQIGRPSTFATIMSKITERNYVEKSGNTYRPTELGTKITNILTNIFPFMNYNYSANLELKLDKIASGKLNSLDMLNDFYIPFKKQLDKAYIDNGSSICDKCGSPMINRTNSKDNTKFISCIGYPDCRNIKNVA